MLYSFINSMTFICFWSNKWPYTIWELNTGQVVSEVCWVGSFNFMSFTLEATLNLKWFLYSILYMCLSKTAPLLNKSPVREFVAWHLPASHLGDENVVLGVYHGKSITKCWTLSWWHVYPWDLRLVTHALTSTNKSLTAWCASMGMWCQFWYLIRISVTLLYS